MLSLEASVIEKLLMQLDRKGYPFASYQLNYQNEKPHILGRGGFSVVYDMVDRNKTDKGYALKLIGLERHTIASKKFWSTVNLQEVLLEQTPYVVRLIQVRELHITIDDQQNLVEALDLREDGKIQEGIILQCILMEQLEPVITRNKFSHTTYAREALCTEEEVLKLAMEIGQGIEAAHKNHILHRDIKLENILWDQSEEKYVLGDFGYYASNLLLKCHSILLFGRSSETYCSINHSSSSGIMFKAF
ncbi:MAG: protein kinase [Eubacteriales bacterium]